MIIKIEELKINTIIGVYDFEKTSKQPIVINAEIEIENKSINKLDDTLDYEKLTQSYIRYIEQHCDELLETLLLALIELTFENSIVKRVKLEIQKPEALKKYNVRTVSLSKEVIKK